MDGVIPNTAKELISNLPGVGKYTAGIVIAISGSDCRESKQKFAGAIMSIAFNKVIMAYGIMALYRMSTIPDPTANDMLYISVK